MNIWRRIMRAVALISAALAGNWLGAQLHRAMTGRPAHGIVYRHVDDQGRKVESVPVSANFYPALLCGALGQPRWAFSFLGGVAMSLVVGDALEDRLMAWVVRTRPAIARLIA